MATLPSWVTSVPNLLPIASSSSSISNRSAIIPCQAVKASSADDLLAEKDSLRRRQILVGLGAFASVFSPAKFALSEEVPANYRSFVDFTDGYAYYYPSDWRDFNLMGHDSAFKDSFAALQHVRVSFIPTDKTDVRELGPMDEVIFNLVKNIYAAPNQVPTIYYMQERTSDGKNYWTFEYELASSAFARTAFATIAIGNGRFYTLIVGANERRWSRLRDKLKVVADSLRIMDI